MTVCSKLQLHKRLFIESTLLPSAGHCWAMTVLIQLHGIFLSWNLLFGLSHGIYGKSNPGKVFLLIKMYKYFRGNNCTCVCISCWAAGGWFIERSAWRLWGRSESGTVQQLKEIPIETVSMIDCRLSSGWLDFHFQFRLSRTLSRHSETLPTPFTSDVSLYFWGLWLNYII